MGRNKETQEEEDLSSFPKAGVDGADDNSRREERESAPMRQGKKSQAVTPHLCLRIRGGRQKDIEQSQGSMKSTGCLWKPPGPMNDRTTTWSDSSQQAGSLVMKDLSLNQGHLEPQSWQSPPLSSVKTKVGRVERQREEGERLVNPGRLGEDAGGRREMVARPAEGLRPLCGRLAGSLLTDWMSLSQ